MKVTSIPAQITTVEDRIAGNLNLTQLLLLAIPLFLTAVIFFLLPPIGSYSLYKLLIAILITFSSSIMAIRIKDKLVIDLIKVRVSFELRPHIYVFRKQQLLQGQNDFIQTKHYQSNHTAVINKSLELSPIARVNSYRLLTDSGYQVAFQTKTGGLIVKVTTLQ